MKTVEHFDAIVIGSGFGGAVTACRLTEAGLKTCILERGRRYSSADLPVLPEETFWAPKLDEPDERKIPDFMRAFWKLGQGLWDVRDLGELVVGQAAGFGGGSLIYANVHLRAPEEVFAEWPEEYRGRNLADYYDLAAYMLDVQRAPLDLPKTIGLQAVAGKLKQRFSGFFPLPLAVNFGPEKENRFGIKQGACDMRGECCFGCQKQAKNTLDLNYLAAAEEQGAEARTLAEVIAIKLTNEAPRYEVIYRNHLRRGHTESVRSNYVFLCAGAVNTTELLLRSRKFLPMTGEGLGKRFHPNADELGVVFDCDEEQETDRGPTITSSLLYEDKDSWLMIQDGGLPAHLEPLLGMFRSPLWLHRNGFERPVKSGDEGDAKPASRNVALSQRTGYAELPVDSIVDVLTGLTGSAIAANGPLAHDISRSFLTLARGGRNLEQLADPHNEVRAAAADGSDAEVQKPRMWSLCPDQLHTAVDRIRESVLADAAIASETIVETFIRKAAGSLPDGLLDSLRGVTGSFDVGTVTERELREWALQVAIQEIWGSEAGLLGGIANLLSPFLAPAPKEILHRVSSLLRWALDYRAGDGHTAVLLCFGRDSKPATLELVADEIPVGTRISGKEGSGILVGASDGVLVLTDVRGTFEASEIVHADSRPIGICRTPQLGQLEVRVGGDTDPKSMGDAATSASLRVLFVEQLTVDKDRRRFRTDSYRHGRWEQPPERRKKEARLEARLAKADQTPERGKQELLLREVAQALGGELRTDPLWPFLGRRVTVHSQGGCPMAEHESVGVTKASGEVFGCDGLYVMDAAAFPSPVGVNPSATIAAVAERKIQQFLRQELGKTNWTAKEMKQATQWAKTRLAVLDPIGAAKEKAPAEAAETRQPAPHPTTASGPESAEPNPPPNQPIGIEFTEVMRGTHRLWVSAGSTDSGPESEITTDLTARIDDLAAFLAADREGFPREIRVKGGVRISWENSAHAEDYDVDPATSSIKILSGTDEYGNETRSIEYRLEFEARGQRYTLDGVKDIRDDARFDLWEDTTTLTFLLYRYGEAEPCRWGVLRLPAAEFFGGQLPSFKATNTDDPARQIWALATFARFFFGHLVDVYVPSLERIFDVGKQVVGRGHV